MDAQRKLSKEFKSEVVLFFETHNAKVFSQQLRTVFLEYLYDSYDGGTPLFLNDFIVTLGDLFALLDKAEEEYVSKNIWDV